jgi:hypothetical protein
MFLGPTQVGSLCAKDGKIVGAWYGNFSPTNDLSNLTPSVITFHADGTVELERSDRFGIAGTLVSLTVGSWKKTGGNSFTAKVIGFISDLDGLPLWLLVSHWEGELSEDHNELTIIGSPEFFLCSPSPDPPGYTCPDPLEGGGFFLPGNATFTFVMRRIEP